MAVSYGCIEVTIPEGLKKLVLMKYKVTVDEERSTLLDMLAWKYYFWSLESGPKQTLKAVADESIEVNIPNGLMT